MRTVEDLRGVLRRIDGRGYKAYVDAKGAWSLDGCSLHVEHVQGDPFASPSRVRIHMASEAHGLPPELWQGDARRTGVTAFILRAFADACARLPPVRGSGASGRVQVAAGGPAMLPRSGCTLDEAGLDLRFRVGLPAHGRRVLGREAARLLADILPQAAAAVTWAALDREGAWAAARMAEDHAHVQAGLRERGLVAFVRDGSILPRRSGVSAEPLRDAVPFRAPPALQVTIPTLHHGEVHGLGIPEGVTVVTGGGFHGKTTLLEALQAGIDPHRPGDGREWVVTRRDAVKVRSEDGRAITGVDLRPFVQDIPGDVEPSRFSTADASGSTSLAAGILEALETGSDVLLIDEDTSATNLLVRDARMQALVKHESLTPLIDRVRELADQGVSTVLVTGGSGDYLDVADTVLLLDRYEVRDVTEEARRVVKAHPSERAPAPREDVLQVTARVPDPRSFGVPDRRGRLRVKAHGVRELRLGDAAIDVSSVEQLVEEGQVRAIGAMLAHLGRASPGRSVRELAETAVREAREHGIELVDASPELTLPRAHEVAAAINRHRGLRVL